MVSASAPANVLLLGEYAVLEEGGLGLAVAVDVRAHARASAASPADAGIVGTMGATAVRWPGDSGLLGALAARLQTRYGPLHDRIDLDTTEFFDVAGRKRGFGSSAALTVVLAAVWAHGVGRPVDPTEAVGELVEHHRAAQGGRGSGYDVATSCLGGCVLFTGGARPAAQRVDARWLPPLALFAGPQPIDTRRAIGAYTEWKTAHPDEAARFLLESNDAVLRFVNADSWEAAQPAFDDCARLGRALGDAIGVSASIDTPAAVRVKAVGAGNELGLAVL
ncbi:MAG: hypothetical protein EA382_09255, partial [Spirochaetaceae bacterium]